MEGIQLWRAASWTGAPNVITAVAKTTHYWGEHVPAQVKQTFELQARLERLRARVLGWVGRRAV